MRREMISWILKVPAILLLIASFIAGIYASVKGLANISFGTPLVIGIILVLYFLGEYMRNKGAGY